MALEASNEKFTAIQLVKRSRLLGVLDAYCELKTR